jgi:DNA (cytosine-5)-methyltransferase 1
MGLVKGRKQEEPMPKTEQRTLGHYGKGTKAEWYRPQDLTAEQRETFRARSLSSKAAKELSLHTNESATPAHPIYQPRLRPEALMPRQPSLGLTALSLFSGGGGIDLGFDLAGFDHVASYEIMTEAAETLRRNRPNWRVFGGSEGDVTGVDFRQFRGLVDVIHGGPPCQPFSTAGRQRGAEDARNLFPELVRAVREVNPRAFVAENVPSLAQAKFSSFVETEILQPLSREYHVASFLLKAADFGVPQRRVRLFFVGLAKRHFDQPFRAPETTHQFGDTNEHAGGLFAALEPQPQPCMGAREALGLPNSGYDALSPTLRSGLTGPRHTTSILSSVSALKEWQRLGIWPNGVQLTRELASRFGASEGHYRLSIADCAILQGFPEDWKFTGAVYMATGQIGNSVAPPVAYALASALGQALRTASR